MGFWVLGRFEFRSEPIPKEFKLAVGELCALPTDLSTKTPDLERVKLVM